jgi:oxygen-independent coproporphyrinogen-3 oxidase
MCDGEVALGDLGRRYGIDASAYFAPELEELSTLEDLASFDGSTIRTTSMGRLLVRNVCMVFDRYFQPAAETKFSSTI